MKINVNRLRILQFAVLIACFSSLGQAQISAPPRTPYGEPVSLETAKKAAAVAQAEAQKNGWVMAIAVVDTAGMLVYFENMDGVQRGSGDVAVDKARSASLFRRPTKVFQDAVAAGGAGAKFMALRGAVPIEGGVPLIVGGKVVGAIGLSGGAGEQDDQCARAAALALDAKQSGLNPASVRSSDSEKPAGSH